MLTFTLTFQILICNDMACELFGYTDDDLIGKKLGQLLRIKKREQGALEELEIDPQTGDIVKISGRIVSTFMICSRFYYK